MKIWQMYAQAVVMSLNDGSSSESRSSQWFIPMVHPGEEYTDSKALPKEFSFLHSGTQHLLTLSLALDFDGFL